MRLNPPPNPGISRVTSPSISAEISTMGHTARPDAVDLVTEDRRTADLAVSHEHQQGEGASGDATRQTHQPFMNPGREMVVEVRRWDKSNELRTAHRDADGAGTNSEAMTTIKVDASVRPPQSHALIRGSENVFDDLEGDENPWT
jgi:hypothetical protein